MAEVLLDPESEHYYGYQLKVSTPRTALEGFMNPLKCDLFNLNVRKTEISRSPLYCYTVRVLHLLTLHL